MLELRGVCKSYRRGAACVDVLKGIDLDLAAGETAALVGASGAGKSTLLHLMGALDRPTSGTIRFQGQDIFKKSDADLAVFRNRSIGFVFQFHHLLPEFSAVENVMMPALIARTPRDKARSDAEALLADVGLESRMFHRPGELSGGEQQRVAIARALVLEPALLLADEPTGNLDKQTSSDVYAVLENLQKKRGLTLIMVTHNEQLALAMEHIIRLSDGRLECINSSPGGAC